MIRSATALALAASLLASSAWAQDPDRVSMSLDEFLALYERAKPPTKDPEAPFAYTRSAIRYDGAVDAGDDGPPEAAVFTATVRVQPLRDEGWAKIELLSAEAALMKATVEGRPAPLVQESGWYKLVTDRRTAFDVQLTFAVPVTVADGVPSLSFPLVSGGGNEVRLTLPGEDLAVDVANAQRVTQTDDSGRTTLDVTLPAGARFAVRWQPKADDKPVVTDARVYATTYGLVSVGDGVLRSTSTVDHTVLFAGVKRFRYAVPTDATVLDVRGRGIADWTLAEGILTVDLSFPVDASWQVAVDTERTVGSGDLRLDAPVLEPLDVARAKGWLGVTVGGNLEVAAGEVSGAGAVDVRTLPPSLLGLTQQPVLLGYKYLGGAPTVPLVLTEHDAARVLVTLVDQATAVTTFTPSGRRLSSVTYTVRNHHRQFLRVALPEGADLWSAAVGGRSVQPAMAEDGALLMPLLRSGGQGSALAAFDVEVVYVESGVAPSSSGAGHFEASLPAVDVPSTVVSWTVYVPEQARVAKASVEGSMRATQAVRHTAVAEQVYRMDSYDAEMAQAVQADMAGGALDGAAAPVEVVLPLEGTPMRFERLLALDERLWVAFDYRGLK